MKKILLVSTLIIALITYISCSKSGPAPPSNPCAGVTISVSGSATNATPGQSDGTITVSGSGSSGLTFSLNGGAFQSTTTFSNLAAGTYTVNAKNANGCTGSTQVIVGTTNPCSGVNVVVTGTVTNATIANNDGSISVTATGGTGFTFSINGGLFQPGGVFSNLAAGSYSITAKNSNGCVGSAQFTVSTVNICSGVTITVTTTITLNNPCSTPANGGIAVSATGGTAPYTYSINGGSFQSSNMFNGLAANTYTIGVRDANGCTQTTTAVVGTVAPGPLFNAVKQVLATNCAISGCHAGSNPQNGLDFSINCTIVNNNSRIKARAVDANPSIMPPPPNPELSAADKQKIVNWVNAGGRLSD